MAVKKTVAAPRGASIPLTASTSGELEAGVEVTQTDGGPLTAPVGAVQAVQSAVKTSSAVDALAKARAVKAAKALARKAAAEEIAAIQNILAAERVNDAHNFGEIAVVKQVAPTKEEYVTITIPETDLFDHSHPGVQLNRHKFEPGNTYRVRGDVALEVKKRLAMFHDEQVRLLRPNADRKALADVNKGSQWSSRGSVVPLGRLEDIAVSSDEKIYTIIDF